MAVRDVGYNDFEKKKSIIETPFTTLSSPLQGGLGRIDMEVHVPSKKRILVVEWKVIQIDYLDLGPVVSREKKAEHLDGTFEASAILDLKFGRNDRWRQGQTIEEWILQGPRNGQSKISPCEQLAEYLASQEIAHLKEEYEVTGYLVVVVGSWK
ncbi:hypothetical protein EDD21DRAFT_352807 [Dissophora ornata]|nr:hypothetical protein EDD21DRAFT_352807 [Dissophora ornata]